MKPNKNMTPEQKKADKKNKKEFQKRLTRQKMSRKMAFQTLYAFDIKNEIDDENLFLASQPPEVTKEIIDNANELFNLYRQEKTAIDGYLDKNIKGWDLKNMTTIDRSIFRIAVCDLLYKTHKHKIKITSEYIDFAKNFGSDQKTPNLLRAVLDPIIKQ